MDGGHAGVPATTNSCRLTSMTRSQASMGLYELGMKNKNATALPARGWTQNRYFYTRNNYEKAFNV